MQGFVPLAAKRVCLGTTYSGTLPNAPEQQAHSEPAERAPSMRRSIPMKAQQRSTNSPHSENKIRLTAIGRYALQIEAMTVSYGAITAKGSRQFITDRFEFGGRQRGIARVSSACKGGMEDGGFEIEIVFDEAPASNIFDF